MFNRSLTKWFHRSKDDTLDKFYSIPGAYSDLSRDERFVYIKGTRDDRVLLVAHADTVWEDLPLELDYHNDVIFSKNTSRNRSFRIKKENYTQNKNGIGIGADDRVGCLIAWYLRDLGHSILITSGEEKGCIASRKLMTNKWWEDELNNHQFAVQFDRKNQKDIVFYDIGTNKFVNHVRENTKYKPESGTNTDIRVLCKKICGVNMSVGYYDEHLSTERWVVSYGYNTLLTAREWLSKKNLPKFEQSFADKYNHWQPTYTPPCHNNNCNTSTSNYHKTRDHQRSHNYKTSSDKARDGIVTCNKLEFCLDIPGNTMIECPSCNSYFTQEKWLNNLFVCQVCKYYM